MSTPDQTISMPAAGMAVLDADRLFLQAARAGDFEGLKSAIAADANKNAIDPETGNNALSEAFGEGGHEVFGYLLDLGVDFDVPIGERRKLLHGLAEAGPCESLATLLDLGANVNEPSEEGAISPLMSAAACPNADAVRILLNRGAHVNQVDVYGKNALCWATSAKVIHLLVDAGANIDAIDRQGNTPLMASLDGFYVPEVCAALVQRGADLHLECNGLRPLHAAVAMNRPSAFACMLDAGADPDLPSAAGQTVDSLIRQYERTEHHAILAAHRARAAMRNQGRLVRPSED